MKKIQKQQKGFTIIEVLIVLAIAGLIMLIVFLAVPALQRNSRNTQRKNDVSALLGAVNEWTSNHSGSLPGTGDVDAIIAAAKPGYYADSGTSQGNITITTNTSSTIGTDAADDRVIIVEGAKCDGSDATDGSARQIAVLYQIETAGDPTPTCQDS
ncbi:MAG TPA: type II secretion system protein [Candidatus Saccharimonadales bacterium]|nr:type II secretion system protein [Candidatus Saccharimonadales bacterium]